MGEIIQFRPKEDKAKPRKKNSKYFQKPCAAYAAVLFLLCIVLALTVGGKLNLNHSDLEPLTSAWDRLRYAWSEFVSNVTAEFSLFQQTMDFANGSQAGKNHKEVAMFVVLMFQYFFLSRFFGKILKEESLTDKIFCLLGNCFLQVILSIMCFTYSDQGWKSLMFFIYVISLLGVGVGMLFSLIGAAVYGVQSAFRIVFTAERNGKRYVIKVLKILFNPFIRGYYAVAIGFAATSLVYILAVELFLKFTANMTFIAGMLIPLSVALGKLSERISSKMLVWKGENPEQLTIADKVYLIIAVALILFWVLYVVVGIDIPEYWDWMYQNTLGMSWFGNEQYFRSLY